MVAFALLQVPLVLVGLLAPAALAAPAPSSGKSVVTPFGRRPIDKVHAVPQGGKVARVNNEIRLVDAAGKVVHAVKNDGTGSPIRGGKRPEEAGSVAYASWANNGSSPISSFTTTWSVPAIPDTTGNQTIFISNSLAPASGNAVLQPVLQYGPSAAGGGPYWAVASWYIVGTDAYYSSLISVSVGASLNAAITLTGTNGTRYDYVSSFSNIDGTSLAAIGSDELVWAAETFEAYGLTNITYPSDSTELYPINLRLGNGTIPPVSWTPINNSDEGVYMTVDIDGAEDAKITIHYP